MAADRGPGRPARPRSAWRNRTSGRAPPRPRAPAHRRGSSGPSASVLPISTVRPLRLFRMSPGRIARAEIEFSTIGISTLSRTSSADSMISRASVSAVAAPPMSFFISSMPLAGLMSSPPVSKTTPLPTSVTFGASARPQTKSTSRGASKAAAPDGMNQRQVLAEQFVAPNRLDAGVERLRQFRRLALERGGAEDVGRRVDEVAPERDRGRDALDVFTHRPRRARRGAAASRRRP